MPDRNAKPPSAHSPQHHGKEYERKLAALRAALQEGSDAIARGEYDDIDAAHLDAYLDKLGNPPARPEA